MEKGRPPALVEAEWAAITAAEEVLNASVLEAVVLPAVEGRVVCCGKAADVERAIREQTPEDRQLDDTERRTVEAAEKARDQSGVEDLVLSLGDGFILACGNPHHLAQKLGADHDVPDGTTPAVTYGA